jgi:hypothetical protein
MDEQPYRDFNQNKIGIIQIRGNVRSTWEVMNWEQTLDAWAMENQVGQEETTEISACSGMVADRLRDACEKGRWPSDTMYWTDRVTRLNLSLSD